MAKRKQTKGKGGNKSEAIRAYLRNNPDATPTEVVAALKRQGVDLSTGYVSSVKHQAKQKKFEPPVELQRLRRLKKTVVEIGGSWDVKSIEETIELLKFLRDLTADE